jgi:hypothetical protein
MDTTNHNFTWQSFEFGTIGSSVFYDVAIIDENNIWAVGEIMIADTSVNGYTTYNAVHWDGQEWELKKIGNQGGWACHTVFAFSATDIWFEGVIKWDGVNYSIHNNGFPKEPNGDGWLINKMWGSSSNDLYAVGNNGNIAHYNGGQWRRIESGTTLDIQDIWGSFNLKTNSNEIICIASNIYTNDGREVIQIENRTTKKLPTNGLSAYFEGIWFKPGRKYFVVGGGIHTKQNVNDNADWYRYPSGYINYHYSTSVRGNGLNDIIIGGSSGELLHFNGVSWKNYIDEITITNGGISGITIKERTVVSVGFNGNRAVVIVGKIN